MKVIKVLPFSSLNLVFITNKKEDKTALSMVEKKGFMET